MDVRQNAIDMLNLRNFVFMTESNEIFEKHIEKQVTRLKSIHGSCCLVISMKHYQVNKYNKRILNQEIRQWCKEYRIIKLRIIAIPFTMVRSLVLFRTDADMIAFKLRWL